MWIFLYKTDIFFSKNGPKYPRICGRYAMTTSGSKQCLWQFSLCKKDSENAMKNCEQKNTGKRQSPDLIYRSPTSLLYCAISTILVIILSPCTSSRVRKTCHLRGMFFRYDFAENATGMAPRQPCQVDRSTEASV